MLGTITRSVMSETLIFDSDEALVQVATILIKSMALELSALRKLETFLFHWQIQCRQFEMGNGASSQREVLEECP